MNRKKLKMHLRRLRMKEKERKGERIRKKEKCQKIWKKRPKIIEEKKKKNKNRQTNSLWMRILSISSLKFFNEVSSQQ